MIDPTQIPDDTQSPCMSTRAPTPIWHIYDDAVWMERLRLRTRQEISLPTSYQDQALLELARRLELEEDVRELQADLAVVWARVTAAEAQLPLFIPGGAQS